jgi:STE24 endopeptidase
MKSGRPLRRATPAPEGRARLEPIFTAQQLAEVRAYHWPGYVYTALDLALWPFVLAAIARWLTRPLYSLATRLTARWRSKVLERVWRGPGWAPAIVFAVLLFTLFALLDLPSDVWFGYVREHEFGLSSAPVSVFVGDFLKGLAKLLFAVTALGLGLFGLARRLKSWWWVMGLVASIAMLASALVDPYRSRLYVDQAPLVEGPLRERITALMKQANIDFSDVLVEQTASRTVRLQAYFAGSGPTRTIVLNDSLVQQLAVDEVLAAVAHEAGHVHESRWPGRVMAVAALFLFLWVVEWLFRRSAKQGWFGITERGDVRVLAIILLVFDVSMTLGAPVSAWASRRAESAADQYALALTHDPAAFRSMLVKAARINKMDPEPPWWVKWQLSHPAMGERIAAIH